MGKALRLLQLKEGLVGALGSPVQHDHAGSQLHTSLRTYEASAACAAGDGDDLPVHARQGAPELWEELRLEVKWLRICRAIPWKPAACDLRAHIPQHVLRCLVRPLLFGRRLHQVCWTDIARLPKWTVEVARVHTLRAAASQDAHGAVFLRLSCH